MFESLRRTWPRLLANYRARRITNDMEEEFAFHIDMERRKLVESGVDTHEARTRAQQKFGNLARVRAASRTAMGQPHAASTHRTWGINMLIQDVRYAVRTLAKQPGFLGIVITTLALGIGATTAVFSVLNSVILTPLPYNEPQNLVRLYVAWEDTYDEIAFVTAPDFHDYRENAAAFESLATLYTYSETGLDIGGEDGSRRVRALRVSSAYFDVYGTSPLMGRWFTREEESGTQFLAVLSHRLWKDHTDSDRDIVGKSVTLSGQQYTVVGVTRPNFVDVLTADVDVWFPQNLELVGSNNRGNHYLSIIGRLDAGVTLAQAQAELAILSADLEEQYPRANEDKFAKLVPLFDDVIGTSDTTLYILMGAAALVLLIACVNVANLFLARSIAREKEFAVRAALGSGRLRLATQLLTESLLVAVAGGIMGFAVTFWGVRALLAVSPESLARADQVHFDPRLLGFAAGVTILTGILFGIAPALRSATLDLNRELRDGTRSTGGVRGRRVSGLLVAGQVSLAVVLLAGAGILMKSFASLQRVDLGIKPENVSTFEVHLPTARYGEAEQRAQFHQTLQDRLRALPGVEAVGAVSWLPAMGFYHSWRYGYEGPDGEAQSIAIQVRVIEGDYFGALGVDVTEGRDFSRSDNANTPPVAIISRSAAEYAFSDRDPMGRQIQVGGQDWTVIGVVADVAHGRRGELGRMVYLPHAQYADNRNWAMIQVVLSVPERRDITAAARRELATMDPALVVYKPRALLDVLGREIAQERFAFMLMTIFASVALLMAAIGIYGVLSYSVNQRTHEIGIRMALGAHASQVRRIVITHGAKLAAVGMVVGLAGALGLSRLLSSIVFEVSVTDPRIFAIVVVLLACVALVAGYIPARRATQVNPMEILRKK